MRGIRVLEVKHYPQGDQMPKTETTFTVNYDDQLDDVVSKVAGALGELKLPVSIEDDGLPHDGFNVYKVVRTDV
jgi:hypothetical protein